MHEKHLGQHFALQYRIIESLRRTLLSWLWTVVNMLRNMCSPVSERRLSNRLERGPLLHSSHWLLHRLHLCHFSADSTWFSMISLYQPVQEPKLNLQMKRPLQNHTTLSGWIWILKKKIKWTKTLTSKHQQNYVHLVTVLTVWTDSLQIRSNKYESHKLKDSYPPFSFKHVIYLQSLYISVYTYIAHNYIHIIHQEQVVCFGDGLWLNWTLWWPGMGEWRFSVHDCSALQCICRNEMEWNGMNLSILSFENFNACPA